MSWRPDGEATAQGPPRRDVDRLATVGQRAVGFLADVALAGTVLLTPGMLMEGAVKPDDLGPGLTRLVVLVGFVFLALYEVVPTALWGRTPGKAIVGTRVVRVGDDRPPGWKRSVLRWILPALAFQIHAVGWMIAILLRAVLVLDPLHRSVPDRLAGTIVVRH